MARLLKQSTTVNVKVGPYLDSADGVTPETALSVAVELSKAGGTFAARNSATATAHDAEGFYTVELNATDTNTAGALLLKSSESGAAPVWHEFMVLPANVYDSIVGGSDRLQVDVQEMAAGVITSTVIASDAIGSDELAATAASEIGTAVWANATRTLSGTVTLDFTQALPASPTGGTVGWALAAAEVQGGGSWTLSGTTLTLKRFDGSTFATMTLDSATTPTSRTRS